MSLPAKRIFQNPMLFVLTAVCSRARSLLSLMDQAATTTSGHSPRQLKTSPETGRSQSSCGRSVRRSNADAPHPPSLLSSGQPPLQTSTAPTETPVPYTTPAALPGPLVWPFHTAPLPPSFPSNQTPLVGCPIIEVRTKPFFVFCI